MIANASLMSCCLVGFFDGWYLSTLFSVFNSYAPIQTMANWYYYGENGEKVSVTERELIRLAWTGRILPETKIEDPEGKTAPAKNVEGLSFKHCTNCGVIETDNVCERCGARPTGHRKFCRCCGTALNSEQVICVKCNTSILDSTERLESKTILSLFCGLALGICVLLFGNSTFTFWGGIAIIVMTVAWFFVDLVKLVRK